jgi:hypothetical protein
MIRGGAVLLTLPLAASALNLPEALRREDPEAIRAAVAELRASLGDKAGEPEVADTYMPVPAGGTSLTPDEIRRGFAAKFQPLEKLRWWKVGLDPATMTHALREPASLIGGCVAAARAKLEGTERSLALARDAADFVIWAQERGGSGVFPFPAVRGHMSSKAFAAADNLLARIEQAGKLGQAIHNGWVIDDLGNGGLQFDNAECGVALFELAALTREARYLDAARRSADWAALQPLCGNWNYNAFSVWLLARSYRETGDTNHLAVAKRKALLGVMPGQMTDGPRAGRWLDPHNARPAYHYIMLRALAELAAVLPPGDPDRAAILKTLALGLKTRNTEIVERGIMNKDMAAEVLVQVSTTFALDDAFLKESRTADALAVFSKAIGSAARKGGSPLSPRPWGLFLEWSVTKAGST